MKRHLKTILISIFCLIVSIACATNAYINVVRYKMQVDKLTEQTQLLEKILNVQSNP